MPILSLLTFLHQKDKSKCDSCSVPAWHEFASCCYCDNKSLSSALKTIYVLLRRPWSQTLTSKLANHPSAEPNRRNYSGTSWGAEATYNRSQFPLVALTLPTGWFSLWPLDGGLWGEFKETLACGVRYLNRYQKELLTASQILYQIWPLLHDQTPSVDLLGEKKPMNPKRFKGQNKTKLWLLHLAGVEKKTQPRSSQHAWALCRQWNCLTFNHLLLVDM